MSQCVVRCSDKSATGGMIKNENWSEIVRHSSDSLAAVNITARDLTLRLFELALVSVYFDQFASHIINTDHGIRSKFFYQRLKTHRPVALPLRLGCLYVNSSYGNDGTKFFQRLPGGRSYSNPLISTKILGISMASSFTSAYLTKSEYLTRFLRQNSAEFAIHGSYTSNYVAPIINLRS